MNYSAEEGSDSESTLVRIYMDLTGATETRARSVFMYVCCNDNGVEPGNGKANGMSPLSFRDSRMRLENAGNAVEEHARDWNTFDAPAVPAAGAA